MKYDTIAEYNAHMAEDSPGMERHGPITTVYSYESGEAYILGEANCQGCGGQLRFERWTRVEGGVCPHCGESFDRVELV